MRLRLLALFVLVALLPFLTGATIIIRGPRAAVGGAPALITSTIGGAGIHGGESGAITTTGANLLVVHVSSVLAGGAISVSDEIDGAPTGNTWTALTLTDNITVRSRLYYCYGGTVGANHTFLATGTGVYSSIAVLAFSNATASPFDVENGNTAVTWDTMTTGSVTPSQANTIIVTGISTIQSAGTLSINDDFTVQQQLDYANGVNLTNAIAYKIVTSSGARNPTWDGTVSPDEGAARIAVFKY